MIRQNALLMVQLMQPDLLVDIQMSRFSTFDFDKSEKIITIGRRKTIEAINKFNQKET
jgi:NTE family protein